MLERPNHAAQTLLSFEAADPLHMEIDLHALETNYRAVKECIGPGVQIIASVKGNGYGAGVAAIAATLEKVGAYGVATGGIRDALAIRQAGNRIPIHMFPGILPEAIGVLYENDLMPSIYTNELADAASEVARKPWKVFVKVDSGLGRVGIPVEEAETFVLDLARKPNILVEGIFTHLPFADAAGKSWAAEGLERFDDLVARIERKGLQIPIRQSVATTGVLMRLKSACNAVCVGHLLFGGLGRLRPEFTHIPEFRPVHKSIRTRLINVRHYKTDSVAGAGGKISMKAGTVTGTIPIGLHEGYRAGAPGQTPQMLVGAVRVPVLFVSQEYSVLDLTTVDQPQVGDEVFVLGGNGSNRITIEEIAKWQDTSPLHVVMAMDGTMPKYYRGF